MIPLFFGFVLLLGFLSFFMTISFQITDSNPFGDDGWKLKEPTQKFTTQVLCPFLLSTLINLAKNL